MGRDAGTWAPAKCQERRQEVSEKRIPRWKCEVTKIGKNRNEHARRSVNVAPIGNKVTEDTDDVLACEEDGTRIPAKNGARCKNGTWRKRDN